MSCPLIARPREPPARERVTPRCCVQPNVPTSRLPVRVPGPDTDAVLADAMAEQADVRRLTGTHAHSRCADVCQSCLSMRWREWNRCRAHCTTLAVLLCAA